MFKLACSSLRARRSDILFLVSAATRTAFTGNMVEEVFNVVIGNRRLVLLLFFLSSGLAAESGKKEKNHTHPEP